MKPLIGEFDAKLEIFHNILSQARDSDKSRGPFNIQRLYGGHEQDWFSTSCSRRIAHPLVQIDFPLEAYLSRSSAQKPFFNCARK